MSLQDDDLQRLHVALATLRAERDSALREAEQAQRQRHAFLAGLAHDLRNPLAPLSNGVELLRLVDADPAGRLRTRGILERQVGHLMRIADDLSDLARLAGGEAALQLAPFDLMTVLEALANQLAPALQAQELRLELAPPTGLRPRVLGDGPRLAQAVGHLVHDVQRHAERGSTLRLAVAVAAGVVRLTVATVADTVEPAAPLEDVDVGALGLGLALALQLAQLQGGTLVGQRPAGARRVRFEMTLPLAPADAAEGAPRAAAESPLSVLLADDNVDFSHSFGTMLELLGHRVALVHDGAAAVSAILGSPPDLAFVDIGMPTLDGLEAVRRVRGQGSAQDPVLVAVTGRGAPQDRARAAEAGFDRYLVKPFGMDDVRDVLEAARARRHGAASAGFARTRSA